MASFRLLVLHIGFFHLFNVGIVNYRFVAMRNIIKKNRTFIEKVLISSRLCLVEVTVILLLHRSSVIGVNTHII